MLYLGLQLAGLSLVFNNRDDTIVQWKQIVVMEGNARTGKALRNVN